MTTRSVLTLTFAVALAAVGTVWIHSLVPPDSPTGSLQFLSAAPELPIYDRAGKKVDLSKLQGDLFIIHFWATWCPPCVEELPALSRFWDEYKSRSDGPPVLDLGGQGLGGGRRLPAEESGRGRLGALFRDPDAATAHRFGSTQYPETYIVNKSGRVLFRVQGPVSWSDPTSRAASTS